MSVAAVSDRRSPLIERRYSSTRVMQLGEALRKAIATLQHESVPAADLAAEVLLMHVLDCDRGALYANPRVDLAPQTLAAYFELIAERATGRPTQYITGHQEFWGLDFEVTPDVLIPRPDTEILVETVLSLARQRTGEPAPRIVDVGTGSGCIAIALASELPQAEIFATDISRPALEVARRNARRLGFENQITFVEADLLTCFSEGVTFDGVISNPPYVSGEELHSVQREVREFEPRLAWGGTGNAGEVYGRLFPQALAMLRPGGYVAVEIGYNQAEAVLPLLGAGWTGSAVRPDLAGIPRVVVARKAEATVLEHQAREVLCGR